MKWGWWHVDSYWDIYVVDEDADFYWVEVSLHENGCEVNWTGCTPEEELRLTVTPCPVEESCEGDTYISDIYQGIFPHVFSLKLSKGIQYTLSGSYSIEYFTSVMGGHCNQNADAYYDNDLTTLFPRDTVNRPSIGLYSSEDRSDSCVAYTGEARQVDMWIWWHPGEDGISGAEFMVSYPDNAVPGDYIENDSVVWASQGSLCSGISVVYRECNYEWHWIFRQTLYLIGDEVSRVTVMPHPEAAEITVNTCEEGSPAETGLIMTDLHVNDCGSTGAEKATWGKLKAIYR